MARTKSTASDSAANLGFEAKLWLSADTLLNNMDAAEYKHVVLGLSRSVAQTDEVKTARRQRHFGLAQRARRVRRRGKPPKHKNLTTSAIARINLFLHGATDFKIVRGDTLRNSAFYAGDNLTTFGCVIATARRDSASNPAKPDAADGKRPNDTFFKN